MATFNGTATAIDSPVRAELDLSAVGGTATAITDPVRADRVFGGGVAINTLNRVFDSVQGDFVRWVTPSPDPTGASYPGPGVFGVDTSDYIVEDPTF